MKKVGFLGVVIGPEEIKMKEEKVKGILNWPTLQEVKDIHVIRRVCGQTLARVRVSWT